MISALVLAAGRSERMGTQKLLLPLDGKPAIVQIVDEVLACRVDEVLVVTGGDGPRIQSAIGQRRVEFIENPDPESDMLASVRCGVSAASAACQAILIVLGDQPGISRVVVEGMIDAFRVGSKGIIVPTYNQRRGHPVLVSAKYRGEILTQHDEVGLRGLMLAHGDDITEIVAPNSEVLEDMDTPADYQRIRTRRTR